MNNKALLFVCASLALSCTKSNPAVEKEPPAASSVVAVTPSASASSSARSASMPPKEGLPLLVPDAPIPATKGYDFYPIKGAFLVRDGMRVGRLVDDKIEWVGTLPEINDSLGGSYIDDITGVWPDVEVAFSAMNGRAAQPSIFPMGGTKGRTVRFGEGGGIGWIRGIVHVDKTTLVAGSDMFMGSRFETLRGPGLVIKPITAEKFGCNPEDVRHQGGEFPIALPFSAVATTEKGTLVTIGDLCDKRKRPGAEIWETPAKSRIVELGDLLKEFDYFPKIVEGKGDELWVRFKSGLLHYRDGKFESIPAPMHKLSSLFVSPDGKFHGISKRQLMRFDDGKWTPIARLPRGLEPDKIAMDEKGTIWIDHNGISKLLEAEQDIADEPCPTPFVYLYEVSWKNENKYTFPTTRKALASFPDVAKIKLIEYNDWGRKLGVQVESEAQAEALITHIKATMKDELPELLCTEPKHPRIIEINDGK